MIQIQEITAKPQLRAFVEFPFSLFKDNPYWVPPLIEDEMETFDPDVNPIFEHAVAHFFMAYKGDRAVGRIAAIINWIEVEDQEKPKIRFGWFDVEDDINITKALLKKVEEIGQQHNLDFMEGPVGFSNMDKAGMLVDGFEEQNTMITWYGQPYYKKHLEKLGFEKEKEWVEFEIDIPEDGPDDRVRRFSKLIKKKYNLQLLRFNSKKEIAERAEQMFDLINKTYSDLSTFVPIQPAEISYIKKKYLRYLHPDFINCVADGDGQLVAFAITMPSFAGALQKARGKLFPFGWFHLLRARYFSKKAAFYLIGVDPKYQNKGVTSIIFKDMNEMFNRKGIKKVETNPELEDNKAIQALWNSYENRLHKRRRTYRKSLK